MKTIEYRKYITKPALMSCMIQFRLGSVLHGYANDVSLNGVTIQIVNMPSRAQTKISADNGGLLYLRFNNNDVENSIRLQ